MNSILEKTKRMIKSLIETIFPRPYNDVPTLFFESLDEFMGTAHILQDTHLYRIGIESKHGEIQPKDLRYRFSELNKKYEIYTVIRFGPDKISIRKGREPACENTSYFLSLSSHRFKYRGIEPFSKSI